MANHIGNEGTILVGTTVIAEMRDWELHESADTVEDTVSGDTWKTRKVTHLDWDGTINLFWDETDTQGQVACKIGTELTFKFGPEGNTTGDANFSGTAIVNDIVRKGSHDGMVESTIKVIGNGALTAGTV